VRNYIARIHSGNSDGDFVEDAADEFPFDSNEWFDNDNDGIGDNTDADDDNDLMPDTWETAYDLYPLINDASGDADNDGISNFQEFLNGSNPTTAVTVKNDYNNDGIAGWIWKGISNGNETLSQDWQLTFPLYSTNWGIPNRFYPPPFPDQANWDIATTGDFNKDGDADICGAQFHRAMESVANAGRHTYAQNDLADFDLAHEWQVIGAAIRIKTAMMM